MNTELLNTSAQAVCVSAANYQLQGALLVMGWTIVIMMICAAIIFGRRS